MAISSALHVTLVHFYFSIISSANHFISSVPSFSVCRVPRFLPCVCFAPCVLRSSPQFPSSPPPCVMRLQCGLSGIWSVSLSIVFPSLTNQISESRSIIVDKFSNQTHKIKFSFPGEHILMQPLSDSLFNVRTFWQSAHCHP